MASWQAVCEVLLSMRTLPNLDELVPTRAHEGREGHFSFSDRPPPEK